MHIRPIDAGLRVSLDRRIHATKARHHVTTLTVSIQGCAGNVTRVFAILKRFFNDLPKRRVDQLHTCNHMFQRKKTDVCANLIIDSNNLF